MFEISVQKKISISHSLKWGGISIIYNIIVFICIYLISILLYNKSIRFTNRVDLQKDFWITLIDVIIFTPVIESILVAITIATFSKIAKNELIIYSCVSVLFGSMHLVAGPYTLALVIIIAFQIQIYYLCKRRNVTNFGTLAAEGSIMHIMHNSVVYLFTYYKILH
jgi:hypothetical protein